MKGWGEQGAQPSKDVFVYSLISTISPHCSHVYGPWVKLLPSLADSQKGSTLRSMIFLLTKWPQISAICHYFRVYKSFLLISHQNSKFSYSRLEIGWQVAIKNTYPLSVLPPQLSFHRPKYVLEESQQSHAVGVWMSACAWMPPNSLLKPTWTEFYGQKSGGQRTKCHR